jgi:hypothetical protein
VGTQAGKRERGKKLRGRCSVQELCFEKGGLCCCYGEMFEYRTHTAYMGVLISYYYLLAASCSIH